MKTGESEPRKNAKKREITHEEPEVKGFAVGARVIPGSGSPRHLGPPVIESHLQRETSMKRFNLIELGIVVVSILVLLAMLMPATSKAKKKATHSNCRGNLKQLGNASFLYESDNKGQWAGPQPLGATVDAVSWDRMLGIQMGAILVSIDEPLATLTKTPPHAACKTLMTFTCPADVLREGARSIPVVPGSPADGTAAGTGICRSYVMNLGTGNLAGNADGIATTANAIPVSQAVVSAAGTVYLIESHAYATVFGQRNLANDTYMTCNRAGRLAPPDVLSNSLMPRHDTNASPKKKKINILMYDGHVEMLDEALFMADKGQIMQYVK
jgi:prepilin-type processing-associated H-X9-DG protein